jgi:hypothetical protein
MKSSIELDKKNVNQWREVVIVTVLKQLTNYQTFIVLDSGGRIFQ